MTTHHKQVPLSDVVPGMLLWGEVTDGHGNVLLPAGTVLTTPMLASLARHQIEMLAIAGPALTDAEELARTAQLSARIAWLFRTPGNAGGSATAAPSAEQRESTVAATAMLQRYVTNFRSGSPT